MFRVIYVTTNVLYVYKNFRFFDKTINVCIMTDIQISSNATMKKLELEKATDESDN